MVISDERDLAFRQVLNEVYLFNKAPSLERRQRVLEAAQWMVEAYEKALVPVEDTDG